MKRCTRCGVEKPMDAFHKHKLGRFGLHPTCKACRSDERADNYLKEHARILESEKQRKAKASYKKVKAKTDAAYVAKKPLERKARLLIQYAIRAGRLKRKPCEVCGSSNAHAHHDDHSKPYEVKFLCALHHGERERWLRKQAERERLMSMQGANHH